MTLRSWGIITTVLVAGCDPCTNSETARVRSPDGRIDVVVFERNCGSTTPFSVQVSMREAGDTPHRWRGNLFQIQGTDELNALTARGPDVVARWVANDTLAIGYDPRGKVQFAVAKYGRIAVKYEPEL